MCSAHLLPAPSSPSFVFICTLQVLANSVYCVSFSGKRDIEALRIKCSNAKCRWKGTLGMLAGHVTTCQFTPIPCPSACKNNDGEVNLFIRKDLASHVESECPNRDYRCEYCGEKGTFASISEVHDKTCEMKTVPCPNADCSDAIERQAIKRHLEDCPHTEVPCKYQKIGCSVKIVRRDISAHEEEEGRLHLQMAVDTIIAMGDKIAAISDSVTAKGNENATVALRPRESFSFKLGDFTEMKCQDKGFFSPRLYTSPYGYCVDIKVFPGGFGSGKGTHVSVFARFLEGRNDKELTWPFVGKVTFTILNQLEDRGHCKKMLCVSSDLNIRQGTDRGFGSFISHSDLYPSCKGNTQYLKDDTLYFKVSFGVPHSKPWLE